MSIQFLLKTATGIPARIQQSPFSQQMASQLGVDPYYIQNDVGTALKHLTQFIQGKRSSIKNPIFAQMQIDPELYKKAAKTDFVYPTPYEMGVGYEGASDSFSKQHKTNKDDDKSSNMPKPGKKILSNKKNKNFMKLTAPGTNGKGNPTSRS